MPDETRPNGIRPNGIKPNGIKPKPKRWGVRTLFFLALAALSILASMLQGAYTVLSLTGLLIGLIGASICTFRGLTALK